MTGLNEALEDAQRKQSILKRHKTIVEPVKLFEAEEVGMSQKIFGYVRTSTKEQKQEESSGGIP